MLPNNEELRTWEWWRKECQDLFFFETIVLGEAWGDRFRDFGSIQRSMCNYLTDKTKSRKYMSAFRGSFKSTVLEGYFVWDFCWKLAKGIPSARLYNTATKENTWNFQANIKHDLVSNPLLLYIFPELPKTEKDYQVMTKNRIMHNQVKMDFASLDTTLVSRHYPNWVNDDLENDANSSTEYQREDLKRKWRYQKAVLTRITSKGLGEEIEIGTPFHYQGLNWFLHEHPNFAKLEIPAWREINGEKVITFPELYAMKDFEAKKADMGTAIFSAQYLLQPLSEEDALCTESWLKYWTELPRYRWRSMVIDPGGTEPGVSDPTGITIVDTDENGTMFVAYAQEHWLTPTGLIDLIIKLKQRFDPDDIRIEKEKYAMTIADVLQHRFPRMNISYVEHKRRKKELRIWRLKSWFESKRILVNRNQDELITQLLQYPGSKHDDLLDSLSYQLDIARVATVQKKGVLPSGREFEPNVEESFAKEYDKYTSSATRGQEADWRVNDAVY